jgi:hypothetical protein
MFGWVDRAAGHVRLPGRPARRAAAADVAQDTAPQTAPDRPANPTTGADDRAPWLWGVGGALTLLLLVLAPLTALMLQGGYVGADQGANTAAHAAVNVPPPSPERLAPQSTIGQTPPNPSGDIELSAAVQSDGSADVTETLTLSSQTRNLVLAVPATATPPGAKANQDDAPQAVSIAATVNGKAVGSPTRVGTTPVSVALPAGTKRVVLHYQLVGSTVRSTPSSAGRALTAIAPIAARSQAGLGLVIHVRGNDAAIRNLVCPASAGNADTCATQADGRWRTTAALAAATSFGLAQVDLPQ